MNFIPKIEYNELSTGTFKTITFSSPPEGDPLNEQFRATQKSSRSSAGVRQTQFNYTLKSYNLQFLFQTEAIKTAFDNFFNNHASRGGSFNYFISSDEAEFETFELVMNTYSPKRPIPSAILGEFEYDFKFKIERVI